MENTVKKNAFLDKKALRDLGLLIIVCLIAAMLLALTNQVTEGHIAKNAQLAEQQTRAAMFPAAVDFSDTGLVKSGVNSCYSALSEDGSVIGYVTQTLVNGFGGEILVTVGINQDGTIAGVNVGGSNFSETAGLGAKAKEPAFTDQYIGKATPLTLVKPDADGGEDTVDAIAGATITSSAVNGGVNTLGAALSDLISQAAGGAE